MRTAYLAVQGFAVIGWWFALFTSPAARRVFLASPALPTWFSAFAPPDLIVIGFGSLAASALNARSSPHSRAVLLVLFGALLYSTLFTLTWCAVLGAPWLGASLMLGASLATLASLR